MQKQVNRAACSNTFCFDDYASILKL